MDYSDSEDEAPVNTFNLTDNCYYVTAAKLSGMTVVKLIESTELMQNSGGASVTEIAGLFKAAGLTSAYQTLASLDEVEEAVERAAAGLDRSFGVAFTRQDGSGHMVVARYDATAQQVRFRDYQMDNGGADASRDVAGGKEFHLFA